MADVLVLVLVRAAGETSRFGVRTWRAASQINLIITRVQCTGKHAKQHDALSRAKITQQDEKLRR
jgi:cytosine/uracil/thiamine/allantoin permease